MKNRLLLLAAAIIAGTVSVSAQQHISPEAARLLKEDPTRAGNNTNSYEFNPIVETPAPKGYKPFYVSHIGRHGSRSNWGSWAYDAVISTLTKAKDAGILTASGDSLLNEAKQVKEFYAGMDGHISPRGEREHAMIADRMYKRYPEVFKGKKNIRAISSTVARCACSMSAFTNELCRLNPDLSISLDSHEMIDKWLNNTGSGKLTEGSRALMSKYKAEYPAVDTMYMLRKLFKDTEAAKAIVGKADMFQEMICSTACIAEDWDIPENLYRFVSDDAIYKFWSMKNHELYLGHCNSVEFGAARCPEAGLLAQDFVSKADEVIANGGCAADLRFGHDYPILGLASYFGIEGVGDKLSFDQIDDNWFGFQNIPMASNIQLIFYKNKAGNVLVKFMYNEKERKLRGLQPVQGPYYDWNTVKANIEGYKR